MRLRVAAGAIAALLLALGLTARPPQSQGGRSRDLQAYVAAGRAYARGTDPYGPGIAREEPSLARYSGAMLPFVGTPASLPFWALFSRLPYRWARRAWSVLLVGAAIALALAASRLAAGRTAGDAVAALLVALAFAPVDASIALGQTALAGAAASALAVAGRRAFGTGVWSFAALALQPNLALPIAASLRRPKRWIALLCAALAFAVACVAATSWRSAGAYLSVLRAHAAAESGALVQFTPAAVLRSFGIGHAEAIAVIVAVAAAALAVRAVLRLREIGAAFAALCCALPLASVFFHVQDFAIVLPGAIYCLRRAPSNLFGPALIATLAVGTNWIDIAQNHAALAQDLAIAAALAASACALRERLDRATPLWLAAAVLLCACCGSIAMHDRVPIWPDAMQPFHPGTALSAAQQWQIELARTGLLAHDPASAILRAVTLAGCALLFAIAARGSDVDAPHRIER